MSTQKLVIKNTSPNSEFSLEHPADAPAVKVLSTDLVKLSEVNLKNLADGTLPMTDPLVVDNYGQIVAR